MKDKTGVAAIKEFAGLKPKMYLFSTKVSIVR